MANMVQQGKTPLLPPARLEEIGYNIVAFPLALLSASIKAMQDALSDLLNGDYPDKSVDFAALQEIVGFNDYYDEEEKYSTHIFHEHSSK